MLFFGFQHFYYETSNPLVMPNGYKVRDYSRYGFQDSFMGSCMTCPFKENELGDTIDYFSKRQKK